MAKKLDFDENLLTQATEQHGKDISGLDERVNVLEGKLSKPEQLASVFETATADLKKLDKLFSHLFCEMLEKDKDVDASISRKIKNVDRDVVLGTLKKWGGLFGAGIIFVLGILFRELIIFILSKFPNLG